MIKRGRKSIAQKQAEALISRMDRPRAPHDLTDEETEFWAAIVDSLPADWFTPSTLPLLTQYCRHSVQSRKIAELIERASSSPDLELADYDRLLKMQQRESAALASLATKMRISQQSTYDKSKKKPAQNASRLLAGF
jgi:hypothetical protein